MAEAAEDKVLAEMLKDSSLEGKKKKKPRHKEGRHKLKKDRIEVREKWLAEKKKNVPFTNGQFFEAYQHLLGNEPVAQSAACLGFYSRGPGFNPW